MSFVGEAANFELEPLCRRAAAAIDHVSGRPGRWKVKNWGDLQYPHTPGSSVSWCHVLADLAIEVRVAYAGWSSRRPRRACSSRRGRSWGMSDRRGLAPARVRGIGCRGEFQDGGGAAASANSSGSAAADKGSGGSNGRLGRRGTSSGRVGGLVCQDWIYAGVHQQPRPDQNVQRRHPHWLPSTLRTSVQKTRVEACWVEKPTKHSSRVARIAFACSQPAGGGARRPRPRARLVGRGNCLFSSSQERIVNVDQGERAEDDCLSPPAAERRTWT